MFTSESVTPGHPDKLCDQISDAIVDRMLQQDAQARVVTECAVSTGVLFLAARFDSNAAVDFTKVARRIIEQVGYDQPRFNSKSCTILTSLEEMPETAAGSIPTLTSSRIRILIRFQRWIRRRCSALPVTRPRK